jgi:hypothetical protein
LAEGDFGDSVSAWLTLARTTFAVPEMSNNNVVVTLISSIPRSTSSVISNDTQNVQICVNGEAVL